MSRNSAPSTEPPTRRTTIAVGRRTSRADVAPWLLSLASTPAVLLMPGFPPAHWIPSLLLAATVGSAVLATWVAGGRRKLRSSGTRLWWTGAPFPDKNGSLSFDELVTLELRALWPAPFEHGAAPLTALVAHTATRTVVVFAAHNEDKTLEAARALATRLCTAHKAGVVLQPALARWLNQIAPARLTASDLRPRGARPYLGLTPRRLLVKSDRRSGWLHSQLFTALSGGLALTTLVSAAVRTDRDAAVVAIVLLIFLGGVLGHLITMPRRQLTTHAPVLGNGTFSTLASVHDGQVVSLVAEVTSENQTMHSVIDGASCVLATVSAFGSDAAILTPRSDDGAQEANFGSPRGSLHISDGDTQAWVSLASAHVVLPSTAIVEHEDPRYNELRNNALGFLSTRAADIKPELTFWETAAANLPGDEQPIARRAEPAPVIECALRTGDRVTIRGRIRLEQPREVAPTEQGAYRQGSQHARTIWIEAELLTCG